MAGKGAGAGLELAAFLDYYRKLLGVLGKRLGPIKYYKQ